MEILTQYSVKLYNKIAFRPAKSNFYKISKDYYDRGGNSQNGTKQILFGKLQIAFFHFSHSTGKEDQRADGKSPSALSIFLLVTYC